MLAGIVLSLAASPPVATALGLDRVPLRQPPRRCFSLPTLVVMLAVSFLSPRHVRRLSLVVFIVALALTCGDAGVRRRDQGRAALDRARRHQHPAVRVRQAGLRDPDRLAVRRSRRARPDMPANTMALGAARSRSSSPLVLQPDFGQTMLIAMVWGALFFMAGLRWIWVAGLGGAAARRPRRRLLLRAARRASASSASWTSRRATPSRSTPRSRSFTRGGWFGRGPGEGTVKRILPDSHTDFIFAVAAEEFGVVLCLALVALFAFIVLRALHARAARRRSVHALRRRRASRCCSACSRRSTWRSTCI